MHSYAYSGLVIATLRARVSTSGTTRVSPLLYVAMTTESKGELWVTLSAILWILLALLATSLFRCGVL